MDYTHDEVRAIIKFVLEEERKWVLEDELKPAPEEPDAAPKAKPVEVTSSKPKKKAGRPKTVDIGKLIALWEGGWSVKEIAQELGVSEKTVRNNMPEE